MSYFYERQASCECGFGYRQTALRLPLDEIGEKMSKQSEKHYKRDILCELKVEFSKWSLIIPDRDYFSPPRKTRKRKQRIQYTLDKLNGGVAKW